MSGEAIQFCKCGHGPLFSWERREHGCWKCETPPLAVERERIRIAGLLGANVHREDPHGLGLTVFVFRGQQCRFDEIIYRVSTDSPLPLPDSSDVQHKRQAVKNTFSQNPFGA